jgi:hypothetical protein
MSMRLRTTPLTALFLSMTGEIAQFQYVVSEELIGVSVFPLRKAGWRVSITFLMTSWSSRFGKTSAYGFPSKSVWVPVPKSLAKAELTRMNLRLGSR